MHSRKRYEVIYFPLQMRFTACECTLQKKEKHNNVYQDYRNDYEWEKSKKEESGMQKQKKSTGGGCYILLKRTYYLNNLDRSMATSNETELPSRVEFWT